MKNKILYFEGAGWEGTQRNDMENCRVRTAFTNNDGKKIYLEMTCCAGANEGKAFVDFCHYITDNKDDCNKSRIMGIEKMISCMYTKSDILKFVNDSLSCGFEKLEILPSLSGYYVHDKSENGHNKYTLIDDFTNIPERTAERTRIYKEVAKEYFNGIYQKHIEKDPGLSRLLSKYKTWGCVSMDDKTMTLKSNTYKELISDDDRVKTFEVNY